MSVTFSFGSSGYREVAFCMAVESFFPNGDSLYFEPLLWETPPAPSCPFHITVCVRSYYSTLLLGERVGTVFPCLSLAFYGNGCGEQRADYNNATFDSVPAKQLDWRNARLESFIVKPRPIPPSTVSVSPSPHMLELVFVAPVQVVHEALSTRDAGFGKQNVESQILQCEVDFLPSIPFVSLFSGRKCKIIRWDLFDPWTHWTPALHDMFPHHIRRVVFQMLLIRRFSKQHPMTRLDANVMAMIFSLLVTGGNSIARDGPALLWQPLKNLETQVYVETNRRHRANLGFNDTSFGSANPGVNEHGFGSYQKSFFNWAAVVLPRKQLPATLGFGQGFAQPQVQRQAAAQPFGEGFGHGRGHPPFGRPRRPSETLPATGWQAPLGNAEPVFADAFAVRVRESGGFDMPTVATTTPTKDTSESDTDF